MHAVIRSYTGTGAKELFNLINQRKDDVLALISGVPGFVSYTVVQTAEGGTTITVCQEGRHGRKREASTRMGTDKRLGTGSERTGHIRRCRDCSPRLTRSQQVAGFGRRLSVIRRLWVAGDEPASLGIAVSRDMLGLSD